MIRLLAALGLVTAVTAGPTAEGARWVVGRAGLSVQQAMAAAHDGDTIVVPAGVFEGPLVVDKSVRVVGPGEITGSDRGTVISVVAPGVVIDGLTVSHSGSDRAGPDSCIFIGKSARGTKVQNSQLRDCTFGIWVHQTAHVDIEGNTVRGKKRATPSDRGNGIHLFDAAFVTVRRNMVRDARDGIYVSATEDSRFEDNTTSHLRYGVHYMYSFRNRLIGNRSEYNTGGFALMESGEMTVRDNIASHNVEQGILFRSAQGCDIGGNLVEKNRVGLFFYSSTDNEIHENVMRENAIGMKVWAGTVDNRIRGNAFLGNETQVFYVAAQDLVLDADQGGNFWSDYLGWDQDGDGRGDRPYRVDGFISRLLYQTPAAGLLLKSPALELLGLLERRMPLLRTPTLVDENPLMGRIQAERPGEAP